MAQHVKYPVLSLQHSGLCYGMGSVPDLGTYPCHGKGQKEKKIPIRKAVPKQV